MKLFLKTASRAVTALFAVVLVTMGVASPAFADGATGTITTGSITIEHDGKPTGVIYNDLKTATAAAESGDTILLGKGNYTLYGEKSEGLTEGKDLTFVGSGTDQTSWRIGPVTPKPIYYDKEYNGDYSFDGAGTVTFRNMTMLSTDKDYLGFIRINNTVLEDCVLTGKTFYWGYKTAVFKNTTFNPPTIDYALWTYCSPVMTFDNCTFNAPTGKVINVYTDGGTQNVTVNVNNCTFNSSDLLHKQALTINDSTMGNFKYTLNFTGNNTVTAARDKITCSQLFGFGGKESTNNKGKTDVYINDELVWSGGKMKTHSYTDGEHEGNFVDQNDYVWEQKDDGWYCTGHAKCGYCDWPIEETVKATYTDATNCTEKGSRVYTATFKHKCFKPQTKTETLDPIGHDWGEPEYTWSKQDDGWNCTAKRVCKRDPSHVEKETVKATYEVTTPATTEKEGEGTYTATFKNEDFETQTKTESIDKLPVKPQEPAKPKDDKPGKSDKSNKQALPGTGDSAANVIMTMLSMAAICFAGSAIASKMRK